MTRVEKERGEASQRDNLLFGERLRTWTIVSDSRSAVVSAASRGREAGRCLVIAGPVDHRAASTRYPHTLVLDAAIQIAAGASRGSNPPGPPVFLKEGAEGHKKTVPGRAFEECHVRSGV